MKATVFRVLEDLTFKISEGSDQNRSCPESALLAVSAKLGETPNVLVATCLGAIELKLVNLHMYSVNSQPELSEGRLLPIHSSTVFTATPIG